MYKCLSVCFALCLLLAPMRASAGTVDPCGDRNDCIGLVVVERCQNQAQPVLGAHNYGVVLLDIDTGGQFAYSVEYSHGDPYSNWYGTAAQGLTTHHTYRTHLAVDGAYVGDWSDGISPPAIHLYIYDLPDCPRRIFLPLVTL